MLLGEQIRNPVNNLVNDLIKGQANMVVWDYNWHSVREPVGGLIKISIYNIIWDSFRKSIHK